jgi:hypothetical protein
MILLFGAKPTPEARLSARNQPRSGHALVLEAIHARSGSTAVARASTQHSNAGHLGPRGSHVSSVRVRAALLQLV